MVFWKHLIIYTLAKIFVAQQAHDSGPRTGLSTVERGSMGSVEVYGTRAHTLQLTNELLDKSRSVLGSHESLADKNSLDTLGNVLFHVGLARDATERSNHNILRG